MIHLNRHQSPNKFEFVLFNQKAILPKRFLLFLINTRFYNLICAFVYDPSWLWAGYKLDYSGVWQLEILYTYKTNYTVREYLYYSIFHSILSPLYYCDIIIGS